MPKLQVGYRLNGKYELERFLGEGGFSEVWQVRNVDFEQVRAAKVFVPKHGAEKSQMERFLEEYHRTEPLDHPHILRPDHIEMDKQAADGRRPFMLMDHCEGGHLGSYAYRQRTQRGTEFDEREVAVVMKQVASALATLHDHQMVHGDVKPGNILLRDSRSLFCLLSDFGASFGHATSSNGHGHGAAAREPATIPLSQIELESHEMRYTVHQEVLNDYFVTPEYAAPETLTQQDVTRASDLFALGLVLYELATGRLPFPQTGQAIAQGEQVPGLPRSYFSDKLNYILLCCLERDPAQRQFSARDLAEMAEEYLKEGDWPLVRPGEEPEPAEAYQAPTDWEQVLRVAILVGVLAALAGGAWWWWQRQQEAPRFPYALALGEGGDSVVFLAYAPQVEPEARQRVPLLYAWRGEPRLGEWTRLTAEDGVFLDSTFRIGYEGKWAQGVPHGQGSAVFRRDQQTFARYEGQWQNGQIEGQGRLAMIDPADDDTTALVSGVFDAGRLAQFELPINYAQQGAALQIPTGYWQGYPLDRGNWLMDGYGRGVLRNISDTLFYEGEWKDGLPDGQGTGVFRSGDSTVLACRGIWLQGELEGLAECLIFTPDSLRIIGRFEGKMSSNRWVEGSYEYPDASVFRGQFAGNRPDSGLYTFGPEAYFEGSIGDAELEGRLVRKREQPGVFRGTWVRRDPAPARPVNVQKIQ